MGRVPRGQGRCEPLVTAISPGGGHTASIGVFSWRHRTRSQQSRQQEAVTPAAFACSPTAGPGSPSSPVRNTPPEQLSPARARQARSPERCAPRARDTMPGRYRGHGAMRPPCPRFTKTPGDVSARFRSPLDVAVASSSPLRLTALAPPRVRTRPPSSSRRSPPSCIFSISSSLRSRITQRPRARSSLQSSAVRRPWIMRSRVRGREARPRVELPRLPLALESRAHKWSRHSRPIPLARPGPDRFAARSGRLHSAGPDSRRQSAAAPPLRGGRRGDLAAPHPSEDTSQEKPLGLERSR